MYAPRRAALLQERTILLMPWRGARSMRQVSFLRSLPPWVSEGVAAQSLQDEPRWYDRFLKALLNDKIAVATAVQTKMYTGDCFLYPFILLMEATAMG